jgi:hypothetical protein
MERIADKHSWRRTVELLRPPLQIDSLTAFAFDMLEAQGLRFCVHFGTRNAVDMAAQDWVTRMDQKGGNK